MPRDRLMLLAALALAAASARADDLVVLRDGVFLENLSTTDGTVSLRRRIKGIAGHLLAIDTRPSDGVLYGLGRGRLYSIDAGTGWATALGPAFGPEPHLWKDAHLDFEATGFAARVVVMEPDGGGNPFPNHLFRLHPVSGALMDLTPRTLAYAGGNGVLSNNITIAHGAGPADTLFGIDAPSGTLFRGDAPDIGLLTTVGPLTGVDPTNGPVAMEIAPDGTAHVLTLRRGVLALYTVDLATGAATFVFDTELRGTDDITSTASVLTQTVRDLDVTKAVVRVDFKKSRRHAMEWRGRLPAPADGWKDKPVRFSVSDVRDFGVQTNRDFVLDRRGRGRLPGASFAVASKPRNGLVPFVLKISRSRTALLPIDPGIPSRRLQGAVDMLVDGHPFSAQVELDYVRSPGRGVATLVRE